MNRGCSLVRRMQALRLRTLELAVLLVLLTSVKVPAADRNPFSGDPKEVKAPSQPIGNAIHGKQLFYGDANCSLCHMVEGKGGRVGPELTGVGTARTVEALIESARNPSQKLAWGLTEPTKEFAQEYETVTVVMPDGRQIKGVALNEDNFSLQVMDTNEKIHLLEKDKVSSIKKSRESLMPVYDNTLLSDQDLHDIIAYLLSVGSK